MRGIAVSFGDVKSARSGRTYSIGNPFSLHIEHNGR